MSSWVRYHFNHLKRWREYAEAVARAARDLVPSARVYVVGSVARGRYTVLSDIDILIVVPHRVDPRTFARDVLVRAMDLYGLPIDAPVEIHVVEEGGERPYLEGGFIEVRLEERD